MFLSFIYILPGFVCLMWIVSFCFQIKSSHQKVYTWSLVASLIYYIGYSSMAQPETDYGPLILMDSLLLPAGLTMIATLNMYMNMMLRHRTWNSSYLLWLAPALCIGVAGLLLYVIIGVDTAENVKRMYDEQGYLETPYDNSLYNIYIWVTQRLFNYVSIILGLCLVAQCGILMRREGYKLGDVSRFFFAHHSSTPGRVIATLIIAEFLTLLPMAVLPGAYENPAMGLGQSLILTLIKHLQCHVVYFSNKTDEVTLHTLSHLQFNHQADINTASPRTYGDVSHSVDISTRTSSQLSAATHDAATHDAATHDAATHDHAATHDAATHDHAATHDAMQTLLTSRSDMQGEELRRLLDKEEVWREDDLTINTLAERLHVSRSTLSNIINAYYGQPFRDLVNARRIQAVQRYMLENPTATQEDIATSCGFKTASYMNSKFKETVGTTPLLWLLQRKQA